MFTKDQKLLFKGKPCIVVEIVRGLCDIIYGYKVICDGKLQLAFEEDLNLPN